MRPNKFPSLLKHLLECECYRLTDLAKSTNLHASDLSKIVNGKRVCSGRLMEVIIRGVDEQHRSQLLLAWLLDQVNPQFQHLVHIVKADGGFSVRAEVPDINTVEGALAVLAAQAEVNPAVRTLVLTIAQAFSAS